MEMMARVRVALERGEEVMQKKVVLVLCLVLGGSVVIFLLCSAMILMGKLLAYLF